MAGGAFGAVRTQSLARRIARGRRAWIGLTILTLVFPLTAWGQTTPPGSPSGPFDERMIRLKAAVKRVSDIDAEAWKQPGFEKSAEVMGQAAEVSRATFGKEHWMTRLKQSLADG